MPQTSGKPSNNPSGSPTDRGALRMAWKRARVLGLIACLLTGPGCQCREWLQNGFKVGPEYCPVPAAVSGDWMDGEDPRVIRSVPDTPAWWSVFQDPVLNHLISSAYSQNLTLREAGWRVMQARAQRDIARGNLLPQTQQAFGEYQRLLESRNVAVPPPLRAFDQWSTGFSASWELDVWGRFRRGVESAESNLEAVVGDYDAVLLCLIAEVADAYNDYRTFELRLDYARRNVDLQEQSLQLTQIKADEGATGYTSVHLAKSSLESTRAGIPSLQIGLRQSTNRLCTLLGVPTQDLQQMLGPGGIPSAPPEVAVGIPADLLRRRPDIRAAERAVAAQSEQIGIAEADLYPAFSLTGTIAWDSENFSHLMTSGSNAGSIGPSFRWNILNYGRLVNNVRFQEAAFQELVAAYRNTVLSANQEVEDALVAFLRSQESVQSFRKSVEETEEALRLLTISFDEGDISFTGVFVLQEELVLRQDQLAAAEGEVISSLIAVYKALGGGWEVRCTGFPAMASSVPPPITASDETAPEPASETLNVKAASLEKAEVEAEPTSEPAAKELTEADVPGALDPDPPSAKSESPMSESEKSAGSQLDSLAAES